MSSTGKLLVKQGCLRELLKAITRARHTRVRGRSKVSQPRLVTNTTYVENLSGLERKVRLLSSSLVRGKIKTKRSFIIESVHLQPIGRTTIVAVSIWLVIYLYKLFTSSVNETTVHIIFKTGDADTLGMPNDRVDRR